MGCFRELRDRCFRMLVFLVLIPLPLPVQAGIVADPGDLERLEEILLGVHEHFRMIEDATGVAETYSRGRSNTQTGTMEYKYRDGEWRVQSSLRSEPNTAQNDGAVGRRYERDDEYRAGYQLRFRPPMNSANLRERPSQTSAELLFLAGVNALHHLGTPFAEDIEGVRAAVPARPWFLQINDILDESERALVEVTFTRETPLDDSEEKRHSTLQYVISPEQQYSLVAMLHRSEDSRIRWEHVAAAEMELNEPAGVYFPASYSATIRHDRGQGWSVEVDKQVVFRDTRINQGLAAEDLYLRLDTGVTVQDAMRVEVFRTTRDGVTLDDILAMDGVESATRGEPVGTEELVAMRTEATQSGHGNSSRGSPASSAATWIGSTYKWSLPLLVALLALIVFVYYERRGDAREVMKR